MIYKGIRIKNRLNIANVTVTKSGIVLCGVRMLYVNTPKKLGLYLEKHHGDNHEDRDYIMAKITPNGDYRRFEHCCDWLLNPWNVHIGDDDINSHPYMIIEEYLQPISERLNSRLSKQRDSMSVGKYRINIDYYNEKGTQDCYEHYTYNVYK